MGGMETYRALKDSNIDQPLIIGFLGFATILLLAPVASPTFRAYWRRGRRWHNDRVPLTVYSAASAAAVPGSWCVVGLLVRAGFTTDWLLLLPAVSFLHLVVSVFIENSRIKRAQSPLSGKPP
jgi:hypothetical protein